MKIGIIGAGFIGRALAHLAVAQGHEVMIANSRGPHTLTSTAVALHCKTGTVLEAARFAEVVILAIPFQAIFQLDAVAFDGRIVIDANNYYPHRDGAIAELDAQQATTSGLLARQLPGARVVKAFNAILQDDIEKDARPTGALDRRALPLAGDDAAAKQVVANLVDAFGFDPVDAGSLAESWRFERAMPCYCVPLNSDALKAALACAERGKEVPYGAWRARREAAHAELIAQSNRAMPPSAAAAVSAPAVATPPALDPVPLKKRQAIGFGDRGAWDIVDTQFHLCPQHDAKASLAAMDALGIRSALVDELWSFDLQGLPIPYAPLPGGRYRSLSPLGEAAAIAHPERFAFIQRIERWDPLMLQRIAHLAQVPGCRCLRINLVVDKDLQGMVEGAWDEALAMAQKLEIPVTVMAEDAGQVLATVARRFAGLALIVDHCGWIRSPQQWTEVLGLGQYPNVYLKWSHAHRAFRKFGDPDKARREGLVQAVEAFGADRVMWASDVSFEESQASWSELLSFVRDHPGLSEGDRAWVLGRTARRVHRWET